LGEFTGRKLLDQLKRDSDFLYEKGIMDYSLLLGVVEVSYSVNLSIAKTRDSDGALPCGVNPSPTSSTNERTSTLKQAVTGLFQTEVVVGPGFYYIGIIDVLQTWTLKKRLERFCKTWLFRKDSEGISAIRPDEYRNRFQRKLKEIIYLEESEDVGSATIGRVPTEHEANTILERKASRNVFARSTA
jgi:1-phosphatidylinositol-4-phosphate 5-kinase